MKKNQSPKKKRRVPKAILRLPDLDQLRASPLLQQNGRAPQSGIGGGHGCDAGAGNRNSHGAWRERPSERKCRLAGASALTLLDAARLASGKRCRAPSRYGCRNPAVPPVLGRSPPSPVEIVRPNSYTIGVAVIC